MRTQSPRRTRRPTTGTTLERPTRGSRQETAPSDAVLFACARQGDAHAWQSLVERHTPVLSAVARSYRLSAAEVADAVQITWLRCVEHADRIRTPERLRAWMVTTCGRECLRLQREARRTIPEDTTDRAGALARLHDPDPAADPPARAARTESSARLREAISDLPARQRRVIRALFAPSGTGDDHYADIAATLDLPVGSIGPTRQRALRHLRRDPRLLGLRG